MGILMSLWMFITPVFIPISAVPKQYLTLYMFNPMSGIMGVFRNIFASSALCEKLTSNDDFEIVVRQIENLETHVFEISVSIRLAKHCPHFVIEPLHGGIGHISEMPES